MGEAVLTRREFVQGSAATALFAIGCRKKSAANRPVKIGYVGPLTGSLAAFTEPDNFVLSRIRGSIANGLAINGQNHPIQILVKDSRSDPNRAAEVASELIKRESVDILVTAHTPETVSPVSDQAEINAVPCVTTDAPWQPYFFGRGGKADQGFDWTYHFFWGADQLVDVYTNMWASIETNKVVGALWGNDNDGNSFSDPKQGFPPVLTDRGFTLVDPGRFQLDINDFSAQISAFKNANVEILTGALPPPCFATFWSQAAQQGFRPKIVTIAKALLFPAAVESIGSRADRLTTEVWWSPHHPFRSGLTGQTAEQLCAEYMATTGKPWTPPLGFKHALFDVTIDVLKRVKNVDSPESVLEAIRATDCSTVVGPVAWRGKPVRNVCTTPLVGGQWLSAQKPHFNLVIVNDKHAEDIPTQSELRPLDCTGA
jgi:branched-chain amino acid transport system substrate-binding protein